LTNNSCKITITGKDKMCLLNGEVSGNFTANVDLASSSDFDDEGNEII
jgi:hypothetical protein